MGFKIKGQVTVWIILGVALIAAIAIFLTVYDDKKTIGPLGGNTPSDIQSFLTECTNDLVLRTVEDILPRGGFARPMNSIRFNETDVEYLCETIQYYDSCVQQHPMLFNEIEDEIKAQSFDKVEECFDLIKDDFEKKGWKTTFNSPLDFDVKLDPGKIVLDIKRKITLENEDNKKVFDNFEIVILSPAYDLVRVALEISAQEGDPDRCYFDAVGYSLTYPQFRIELYNQMPDSTKIYTITDKKSSKFMRIAIRSCALPRGI